jgi:hypothetical protein
MRRTKIYGTDTLTHQREYMLCDAAVANGDTGMEDLLREDIMALLPMMPMTSGPDTVTAVGRPLDIADRAVADNPLELKDFPKLDDGPLKGACA